MLNEIHPRHQEDVPPERQLVPRADEAGEPRIASIVEAIDCDCVAAEPKAALKK